MESLFCPHPSLLIATDAQQQLVNRFVALKYTPLICLVPMCLYSSCLRAAINVLKDREPGAFIIRDSHSFRGAYGLAMKVASPPPTVQPNKKGSVWHDGPQNVHLHLQYARSLTHIGSNTHSHLTYTKKRLTMKVLLRAHLEK